MRMAATGPTAGKALTAASAALHLAAAVEESVSHVARCLKRGAAARPSLAAAAAVTEDAGAEEKSRSFKRSNSASAACFSFWASSRNEVTALQASESKDGVAFSEAAVSLRSLKRSAAAAIYGRRERESQRLSEDTAGGSRKRQSECDKIKT